LIGQRVKIRKHYHTGQKSYSTPSEASQVFPPELSFFDRKTPEALGTDHLQATATMWSLNVWENVPMDINYACQQYFTCMCFLGFMRYSKTFIACGFREYEHLLPSGNMILLGEYIFIFPSPACNKCIIFLITVYDIA
jgi:hypothetical protein